jgi:stearoyl-CoA desaturase (delta-9 desaturase)
MDFGFLAFGVFDLPWWGYVLVALGFTHITICAVTLFLHRAQAHRAMELHAIPSHFFRLWLWMTTGMVTREWVAVHRKHHAKCETAEDPHSPMIYGINRVLFGGVLLYVKEKKNPETIERYGTGTPDDWLERNVYSRFMIHGIVTMGLINVVLFGFIPGLLILGTQIIWIPFWAAGVINGVGHYYGYRNQHTPDTSTNIVPIGILIGGEELHNNHHAHATSAKFSSKWYEFDIGWVYIQILQALGLCKVKHVAPVPRIADPKASVDVGVLEAVIRNRYDVLAHYAVSLKQAMAEELQRLRQSAPLEAERLDSLKSSLRRDEALLSQAEREELAVALAPSPTLQKLVAMRRELTDLWSRSMASKEQLVAQLQDWCQRAEQSGIVPLARFSERLRSYA